MNYEAWLGYWFYNGGSSAATAALYTSYGLLDDVGGESGTSYEWIFDVVKFITLGPWAAHKLVMVS